ncbi:MAG: hypothetical protein E4H14_02070 [Candidatus Thorarchaeota archaeon]|nr:MAG: hypothetical protein E4H14_02070 [Candidatus Thorarchaeota archaeon]
MTAKKTRITQFRCKKCNAPYPLGADDVIATCPYCGFTFEIGGKEIKHLIIPNKFDKKSVKVAVTKWLEFAASKSVGGGVVKQIELEEPILQWIPIFRVTGQFESYHFGVKKEGSGDSARHIKIEDRDSGELTEWVIARRHAATFGIDEFILSLEDGRAKNFEIDLTDGAPVLNSEIDEADASKRAHKSRMDRERVELLDKVDKLLDHRLNLTPETSTYTHAPYWLVRFTYQKGTFRVAVSGATGEILLGELPVTKRYRIKKWFSSLFLLVGSGLLFQVLPYLLLGLFQGSSSDGDVWMIPVIMIAAAGLLWSASIIVLGGALRYEVEVNTEGKERGDKFSITEAIKKLGGK